MANKKKWQVRVPILTTHYYEVEAETEAEAIDKGTGGGHDVHESYQISGDTTALGEAEARLLCSGCSVVLSEQGYLNDPENTLCPDCIKLSLSHGD